MKRALLAGLLLAGFIFISRSATAQKLKIYKVRITYMSGKTSDLVFGGFTDSSVLTYSSLDAFDPETRVKPAASAIPASSIKRIVFRPRNRLVNGLLIGTAAGAAAGAVAGLIRGEESHISDGGWFSGGPAGTRIVTVTAGENAAIFAVLGGMAGSIVGTIIGGLNKNTFVLDGSLEKFEQMRLKMHAKVYRR